MLSNTITRVSCVVCNGLLAPLAEFKNFPLYPGVTIGDECQIFEDMICVYCDTCGCVQLKALIKPELLYKRPHNPAIGPTWAKHNSEFSKLISEYTIETIIDIGGANMNLANILSKENTNKIYHIIDYSTEKYKCVEPSDKIRLHIGSGESTTIGNGDAIVLSHTLEHIHDPVPLLKNLHNSLAPDGKIFISVPNVKNQLIDGFLNAMFFEHAYYIDHHYVDMMATRAGFVVERRVDFSNHNSFYVLKKGQLTPSVHPEPQLAKQLYQKFVDGLKNDVKELNKQIKGRKVYLFGAHIFSQYLINAGLNVNCVIGIIDNDKNKIGNCLYGTNIMVVSPDIIRDDREAIVIIRVAQFKNEIVKQLLAVNKHVRLNVK